MNHGSDILWFYRLAPKEGRASAILARPTLVHPWTSGVAEKVEGLPGQAIARTKRRPKEVPLGQTWPVGRLLERMGGFEQDWRNASAGRHSPSKNGCGY